MSRVKSKGTTPELYIRKALWHAGFRYRLKSKLPGKPDIILKRFMVAIFIHGCFWHNHKGCPKSKFRLPDPVGLGLGTFKCIAFWYLSGFFAKKIIQYAFPNSEY
jgi:hypothetical protein